MKDKDIVILTFYGNTLKDALAYRKQIDAMSRYMDKEVDDFAYPLTLPHEDTKSSISEWLDHYSKGVICLAINNTTVVGMVLAVQDKHNKTLNIRAMYVGTRHRKKKLAHTMLVATHTAAKLIGYTYVTLMVHSANKRAQKLYKTFGYSTLTEYQFKRL